MTVNIQLKESEASDHIILPSKEDDEDCDEFITASNKVNPLSTKLKLNVQNWTVYVEIKKPGKKS